MMNMTKIFGLTSTLFCSAMCLATDAVRSGFRPEAKNEIQKVDDFSFRNVKTFSDLPDPAIWQSYDCIQWQDITYPTLNWGFVTGRVYRPIWDE